jgi:hypothetical protein
MGWELRSLLFCVRYVSHCKNNYLCRSRGEHSITHISFFPRYTKGSIVSTSKLFPSDNLVNFQGGSEQSWGGSCLEAFPREFPSLVQGVPDVQPKEI